MLLFMNPGFRASRSSHHERSASGDSSLLAVNPSNIGGILARLNLTEYQTMGYLERCRRIGDLLGMAAVISFRRQRLFAVKRFPKSDPVTKTLDLAELFSDDTEKKIVRHLLLAGEASPVDFCVALSISSATVFRKLARLRNSGVVTVLGRSRAAKYRLTGSMGNN